MASSGYCNRCAEYRNETLNIGGNMALCKDKGCHRMFIEFMEKGGVVE